MNFVKVISNGVSRYIADSDRQALIKARKDFDGRIVVDDNGDPKIYNASDLDRIKSKTNNKVMTDNTSIKNIFKSEDTIKSK